MGILDLEIGLSPEESQVREAVHRFASEVLRPIGRELDRMADPAAVIAPESPLWTAHERFAELGLGEVLSEAASPAVGGDPARSGRLRAMAFEELGWGDSGLAISLTVASFHRIFDRLSGRPQLIERFCSNRRSRQGRREIGCWAITEPNHGSDQLAFTEPSFRDPRIRADCVAVRDGDSYVIRGQKSAWVSNGTIADVAVLFCSVAPEQGLRGGAVALVPLDLPGVSRGKPLDKLGQRPLNQGELFFDEVRIPAEYVVVGPELYEAALESVLAMANAAMGAIFVGVARAALEHALEYAKTRVQGGVAIVQHQSVKARLFRMFSQFEAARSLARRVMIYNSSHSPEVHYSIASKVFCTDAAFRIASDAVQIFGGNGLAKEYPVEKLLRDARASMIEDGCNEVLSLVGASRL